MSLKLHKYLIFNDHVMPVSEFDDHMLTGESLYEVIRVIDGIPLFIEEHLDRLCISARLSRKVIWLNKANLEDKILQLTRVNNIEVGNIELIFNYKQKFNTKIFIARFITHKYPNPEQYSNGVNVSFYKYLRTNPNAKVRNVSLRDITNNIIKTENVFEVILLDSDEGILEGSRSNVFLIRGKTLYTAPVKQVLSGVTRKCILEIAKANNLEIREEKVTIIQLSEFESMFISGTSPAVLPVSKAGNFTFSTDNHLLRGIMYEYNELVKDYISLKKHNLFKL